MRWKEVIDAAAVALNADTALTAVIGVDRIWPEGETRPVQFDSIEWSIISDFEEEVWNPILVQWDIRTLRTPYFSAHERAALVEARLRLKLHREVPYVLNGVYMSTELDDARTIGTAEPTQYHRQVDIRFTPLRAKYARLSPTV